MVYLAEPNKFCKEKWSKIPPAHCAGLIHSHRKCLLQVIAAKGGLTFNQNSVSITFFTITLYV